MSGDNFKVVWQEGSFGDPWDVKGFDTLEAAEIAYDQTDERYAKFLMDHDGRLIRSFCARHNSDHLLQEWEAKGGKHVFSG